MLKELFFNPVQNQHLTKANVDTAVLWRKEFQEMVSPASRHEAVISYVPLEIFHGKLCF